MNLTPEIMVMGVMFGEEAVQINFIEKKHTTKKGGIEQALTISREDINDLIVDIELALAEVIEDYFLDLRDPPEVLPTRSRFSRDADEDDPVQ